MPSLRKDLRSLLENTVRKARALAEQGALEALTTLGVDQPKPFEHLKPEERKLRNQLRAAGRQAGDGRDERTDRQTNTHLVGVVAYEHWHRMLFARFLAENGLLLESEHQVPVSLGDVAELARDAGADIWDLAGRYAQRMLPAVFRADDPVLRLTLARETRAGLETLVADLPVEIFTASDSLGWTYQFWQADRKDEVNESGVKIGADELPSVTQLFTEDYMVDFLLDNTLGAWHAGKVLAANPKLAENALSEDELRQGVALPGCPWKYLRFIKGGDGKWTPAAGTFEGWPKSAAALRALDPCMGSGHFVVAMFERLVALRLTEEKLDEAAAVAAVIRDNLFGLEIDPRCTQIGAFNLALAAWRRVGHCKLPAMNLACSGLAPNTKREDWLKLTEGAPHLRFQMGALYDLFEKAPVLGSLINPRADKAVTYGEALHDLQPLLEKALAQETNDDTAHEMAVTARGLTKAAEILAGQFTLVATNVPYLGRGKQDDLLLDYCERVHRDAKADLATCFIERCLDFCARSGSTAVVAPQNWWFHSSSRALRASLLSNQTLRFLATLGEEAWQTFGNRGPLAVLMVVDKTQASDSHAMFGVDALPRATIPEKSEALQISELVRITQAGQFKNPDHRITICEGTHGPLLEEFAGSYLGLGTCDAPHYTRCFWELPTLTESWSCLQAGPSDGSSQGGREQIVAWDKSARRVLGMSDEERRQGHNQDYRGSSAWGRRGVAVSLMRTLRTASYDGDLFEKSIAVLVPKQANTLLAIKAFADSPEYFEAVRRIDNKVMVTNATLAKVPFDLAHWEKVAAEKYPLGLPKPFSSDPTQWLFNGHPAGADQPLHVAVARLLGYQWPRQTGSSFPDCPALGPDGLEAHIDTDGIVCMSAVRGERIGADRLRTLLSASLGKFDEHGLIAATGSKAMSLETWLRDDFFAEHCGLFHTRPFIWHIWDGRSDGFHALVNYHKLAAPGGAGRKLLELLTFSYLGDWIKKQRDEQKKPGAEDRLIAAEALQQELKAILAGEPPYDIFVRWKPLHQQPIGWEPDLNDGVRLNIRPFLSAKDVARKGAGILRFKSGIKWDKDRGKEPMRAKSDVPWFWGWDETTPDFAGGPDFDGNRWNDCHYTTAAKRAARERAQKRS
jgi:hypothetical protein